MTHLDLFSGIGGFALAAKRVWPGIKHVFCEIDPFCQAVLKKHWPNSTIYGDIRTLTNPRSKESCGLPSIQGEEIPTPGTVDLLTGGFPCQPFSHAGKRKGTNDDRHLWPEMRRVIQEFSPRYVVAENVRGLLSIEGGMVFEQVCTDLENLCYEVQPFVIPACAVNAPHRRDRVWIVAHAKSEQTHSAEPAGLYPEPCLPDRAASDASRSGAWVEESNPRGQKRQDAYSPKSTLVRQEDRASNAKRAFTGTNGQWSEDWPQVATRLCTLDDGLPDGLVRPRGWRNAALKAAGNAIVPQVAEQIFRAIKLTI